MPLGRSSTGLSRKLVRFYGSPDADFLVGRPPWRDEGTARVPCDKCNDTGRLPPTKQMPERPCSCISMNNATKRNGYTLVPEMPYHTFLKQLRTGELT